MFCLDALGQSTTLVNMRWRFTSRMLSRLLMAALAVVLVVAVVAARRPAQAASSEYQQQLQALEQVWDQGRLARRFLQSKRLLDPQNCSKMYRATVASKFRWESRELVEIGQKVFDQGCLARGESAPSEILGGPRQGV